MDGDKLMYFINLLYMFIAFISFKRLHTSEFTIHKGFYDPKVVKPEAGDILLIVNRFSFWRRIFGGNESFIKDMCVVLGTAPFDRKGKVNVRKLVDNAWGPLSGGTTLENLLNDCMLNGEIVYLLRCDSACSWNRMTKWATRVRHEEGTLLTDTGKLIKALLHALHIEDRYYGYTILPEPKEFIFLLNVLFNDFNPSIKSYERIKKKHSEMKHVDHVILSFKGFMYSNYKMKVD